MDESLQAQVETYLSHLDGLIRRGLQLRDTLATDPSNGSAMTATRAWQEDCGVTVNQLSGGSKSHWLARSFSEAFLMRSEAGQAVEGVAPAEIVKRLIDVLEQAVASLSGTDDRAVISASSQAPHPHRFDFVHNLELRPVVEQAYTDSRRALEQGDYDLGAAHILRNSGGHRDRRAGTQGAECTGRFRCARREDFRLVVRDAARRRREGGTDSQRVCAAARSCAEVSRSR